MKLLALMFVCIAAFGQATWTLGAARREWLLCGMNAADVQCAYRINAPHEITVSQAWLYVYSYTAGPHSVRISLQTDASGAPSGTMLAYVDVTVNSGNKWFGGTLSENVTLSAGSYWITIAYLSYTSGQFNVIAGKQNYGFIAPEMTVERRYASGAWGAASQRCSAFLLVNKSGQIIRNPVPLMPITASSSSTSQQIMCRFPYSMRVLGIYELTGMDAIYSGGRQYTLSVHGQTRAQITVPPSNNQGGFYGMNLIVLFTTPVVIGRLEPLQITIGHTGINFATQAIATNGLPTALQQQMRPFCSGGGGNIGLIIDRVEPLSGGFIIEQ